MMPSDSLAEAVEEYRQTLPLIQGYVQQITSAPNPTSVGSRIESSTAYENQALLAVAHQFRLGMRNHHRRHLLKLARSCPHFPA